MQPQGVPSMSRLQQIQAMLAEDPNDPELHYMLAMELVSMGDDAAAVRAFQALLEMAPTYPPAYHQAARALQRLNRIDEARAMLQKGIPVAMSAEESHAAGEMQGLLESLE